MSDEKNIVNEAFSWFSDLVKGLPLEQISNLINEIQRPDIKESIEIILKRPLPPIGFRGKNFKEGKNCVIADNVVIGDNVTFGDNVEIDRFSRIHSGVTIRSRSKVGEFGVVMEGSLIGADVILSPGVWIERCVTILDFARIRNDVRIDDGSHVSPYAIVEEWAQISELVLIGLGAVIGTHVHIKTGVTIGARVMVPPRTFVTVNIPDNGPSRDFATMEEAAQQPPKKELKQ